MYLEALAGTPFLLFTHILYTLKQPNMHTFILSGMVGDWSLSLLDKVFVLLEAHEAPAEGKKYGESTCGDVGKVMVRLSSLLL